ncbi:sugar phosphate isomerase/epimerase family protein [Caldisericum sp. AR60]|uniref:sugar phosphate isomerase/epimerase family protein n=1 Tax=Caldisericum sp. AR60 TaxID=3397852 RepID=UPI0039FD558D
MIRFGFSYSDNLKTYDLERLYIEGLRVLELSSQTPKDFIKSARFLQFEFTFHVNFLRGMNPSYPIEDIRRSIVSEMIKEIEYAKDLGAYNITVHGGYISWFDFIDENLAEYKDYDEIAQKERMLHLKALKESLEEIIDRFSNVKISVENLYFPFELLNNPYELKDFVYQFNKLYITLDFGHAKISKYRIFDYVNLVSDRIAKLHLHTNDGKYDLHRPIESDLIDNDFSDSLIKLNSLDKEIIGIIELHRDYSAISKSFKNIKNLLGGGVV